MSTLTGSGSQKQRLAGALSGSLIHIKPDQDLPSEIRSEFEQFMEEMTSVDAEGEEGTIQATVESLDEMGVHQAVERIISFHDTVCRHQEPH